MTARPCIEPGCDKPARTRGKCPACYERDRTRQKAYGRWQSQHVDAQPVRDHVHALREAGISNKRLRELTGVSTNTIQVLMTGRPERGHGPSKKVLRRTADRILAVPVPEIAYTVASPGRIVPALGTTRRLQALVANGYSQRELCRRLGWAWQGNATALFLGRAEYVVARRAREVADLFTELQLVPGTDVRARNRARANGWAAPLDWDEDTIDDPNATTAEAEQDRPRVATTLDEFEWLLRCGEVPDVAAKRCRVSLSTIRTYYAREGRDVPQQLAPTPPLPVPYPTSRARRPQVAS
ncbi:helix-turn-helix DNA-binding domain protein [Gordonia phage Ohgeesy]|uniref:Helix-turn-helix DNA binding domain protein n=1 Tax=Gordonia phage Ohgeesy TaxID=2762412 RepID=A0A7G8LGC1_9CAUD|nr:helix-turn-helix DNA-binding domain protein [Gordonia phage Ohgeesy]QNJ56293.1 helix-turn-helix DNA-binding domain protein [Gordonia phage Ohgeesy]